MTEIIKKIFLEDWKGKLFSLFLAFIIWLLISLGEWSVYEVKITIPVNFKDLPHNITVFSASTTNIELSMKVPKKLEQDLKRTSPELNISLSQFKAGQIVVPVNRKDISNIPKGVEISRINPSSIVLNLDKLVEKSVPVEPVIKGKEEMDKIVVDPKRVRVLCPSALLPLLKTIPTEPVEIYELRKKKEISTSLLLPDPRLILIDSKYIKISLERGE
jgi:YbbR domain-containing protein